MREYREIAPENDPCIMMISMTHDTLWICFSAKKQKQKQSKKKLFLLTV